MKNLRLFSSLVLSALSFQLNAAPVQSTNIFPVMAWNHIPDDLAVMQKLYDCGFTVAGFVSAAGLKNCEKIGLKAIVYDSRTANYNWENVDEKVARTNVASLIKETENSPAVYGYYLRDEPRGNYFKGLETVASLVREMAPGKWPYINLFPNYAEPWQMDADRYEAYVEKFVKMCHPTTLSYDHYALMGDGSLRGSYWQNLEQMRAAAKKHKLPFWNIVLTAAHFDYREPTAADLRFQVYSTLAYGGRGIAYFTYFAPAVGNYRGAPIDQFGNPTASWALLQNVNLQIKTLAPTLLKLNTDEVYHFGSTPAGCDGPSEKSLLTGVGGDVAVGDFTHEDGTRYVMIVNKNVTSTGSIYCSPQFRTAPKKLQQVSPYHGGLVPHEGEYGWLAPGAGVLLKVE